MANKFKIGDQVLEKGLDSPIMTIKGNAIKKDIPYGTDLEVYVCEWETPFHSESKEIREDNLTLYKLP